MGFGRAVVSAMRHVLFAEMQPPPHGMPFLQCFCACAGAPIANSMATTSQRAEICIVRTGELGQELFPPIPPCKRRANFASRMPDLVYRIRKF